MCTDFETFAQEVFKRHAVRACTAERTPLDQTEFIARIVAELHMSEENYANGLAALLEPSIAARLTEQQPDLLPHIRTIVKYARRVVETLSRVDDNDNAVSSHIDAFVDAFRLLFNQHWATAIFRYVKIYTENKEQLDQLLTSSDLPVC